MPNHVTNTLFVTGNSQSLAKFKSMFVVHEFEATFNLIHTMPKELEADTSPLPKRDGETDKMYKDRMLHYRQLYGFDNWYDWRIANWTTKWDAYEFHIDTDEPAELNCQFDTAWSPPTGWLIEAGNMFKDLHFELSFIDEGDNFCGLAVCKDGVLSLQEADVEYHDEDGVRVRYDANDMSWVYPDGKKLDEDFYPTRVNPLV